MINCVNTAHVEQLNSQTTFIDGSALYGVSDNFSIPLREMSGGRLRVTKVHGTDFPLDKGTDCQNDTICFRSGEIIHFAICIKIDI